MGQKSTGGGSDSIVGVLADYIGAPEAALRLLLSLLAGYPLATIYHYVIYYLPKHLVHLYFALTGLLICLFNYGIDTYHSLLSIIITYLMCKILRKSKYLITVNFLFHMGYLLIGYYFTESNDYDIKWTMPHCVLVLRLIGFGFDIADGQKFNNNNSNNLLSKEQLENKLIEVPSLLELSAYTYFPASFLVGPQFPFSRYNKFINNDFTMCKGNVKAGLIRGSFGIFYLIIRQIGSTMIPDEYLLTNEFANLSFLKKLLNIGIWGKISLYKYISCWLITEGALICFGLTYNGKFKDGNKTNDDENDNIDWSGCSNVKLQIFEMATKMEHYVHSFNVNTNQWVASYVYKRLKFLNNRTISYASALLFLAIWHGFHSGYYMSFFLEYIVVTIEKQFYSIYCKYLLPNYTQLFESTIGKIIIFIIMKLYNTLCLGWCLIPFIYLSYGRWMSVYKTLYYYGYIAIILWFILYLVIIKFGKKKDKTSKVENTIKLEKED